MKSITMLVSLSALGLTQEVEDGVEVDLEKASQMGLFPGMGGDKTAEVKPYTRSDGTFVGGHQRKVHRGKAHGSAPRPAPKATWIEGDQLKQKAADYGFEYSEREQHGGTRFDLTRKSDGAKVSAYRTSGKRDEYAIRWSLPGGGPRTDYNHGSRSLTSANVIDAINSKLEKIGPAPKAPAQSDDPWRVDPDFHLPLASSRSKGRPGSEFIDSQQGWTPVAGVEVLETGYHRPDGAMGDKLLVMVHDSRGGPGKEWGLMYRRGDHAFRFTGGDTSKAYAAPGGGYGMDYRQIQTATSWAPSKEAAGQALLRAMGHSGRNTGGPNHGPPQTMADSYHRSASFRDKFPDLARAAEASGWSGEFAGGDERSAITLTRDGYTITARQHHTKAEGAQGWEARITGPGLPVGGKDVTTRGSDPMRSIKQAMEGDKGQWGGMKKGSRVAIVDMAKAVVASPDQSWDLGNGVTAKFKGPARGAPCGVVVLDSQDWALPLLILAKTATHARKYADSAVKAILAGKAPPRGVYRNIESDPVFAEA